MIAFYGWSYVIGTIVFMIIVFLIGYLLGRKSSKEGK